ncbi:MAG: hypothetical protein HY907_15390 [Deltaproteobacteria bacterium]|nr:hypothetical protein [Deltaproteobacteria bacterium]
MGVSVPVPGLLAVVVAAATVLPFGTVGPGCGAASSGFEMLQGGDQQLPTGEWFDPWCLTVRSGEVFSVEVVSSDFRPYLIIAPPGQDQIDAPSADAVSATVEGTAVQDGRLWILVTTERPEEWGDYELSSSVAGLAQGLRTYYGWPSAEGGLGMGDFEARGGVWADGWTVPVLAGQPVSVRATSPDFDPYLIVVPPGGQRIDNDDVECATAGVDATAPADGTMQIVVTSHSSGEGGEYRLWVTSGVPIPERPPWWSRAEPGAPEPQEAAAPPSPPPSATSEVQSNWGDGGEISRGETWAAELTASDPTTPRGAPFDEWRVESPGTPLTIRCRSSAFDCLIVCSDVAGNLAHAAATAGTDAVLPVTLGEFSPRLRIYISSRNPAAAGSYQVSLE